MDLGMNRWIERALDIHPGDLRSGVLLSSCLFLTISASVIGKVANNALFLGRFQAVQLPYADIASGVLVGFVVVFYLRLGRRTSLGNLLVGSSLFLPPAARSFGSWLVTTFPGGFIQCFIFGWASSQSWRPPRYGPWPTASSQRARQNAFS